MISAMANTQTPAFYHPGKPGEVSHAKAAADIAAILSNPFTTPALLARIADCHTMRREGRPICAPGAMFSYLKAAALRDATRGE